jgi:hypothetical protein
MIGFDDKVPVWGDEHFERAEKPDGTTSALERRVFRIKNLPPELGKAIEASKMEAEHDHLNSLLDGK